MPSTVASFEVSPPNSFTSVESRGLGMPFLPYWHGFLVLDWFLAAYPLGKATLNRQNNQAL
ncbi:MAG: hypothetical protein IM536_10680 [Pseudanabaena sp. M34BS1SP1A06MG]|nr:hypothetical protein [Pseudanabaena sp. M34BS1SP1A06MG]